MLDEAITDRTLNKVSQSKTIIEAIMEVLRVAGRPLHAHEIVKEIQASGICPLSGSTPWKTVTAKLSTEIRTRGDASRFQRVGHARFALREWGADTEFLVNRRRVNPIDETINVIPQRVFNHILKRCRPRPLYKVNVENLIAAAVPMKRADAEETEDFVQLIPTFVVRLGSKVLTYRRTKRLPEARLHDARCVSFGGHMQTSDLPDLFAPSYLSSRGALFRELYEELSFSREIAPRYLGVLYLESSLFERQHAGIVFEIRIRSQNEVESLEKTRHADVHFKEIREMAETAATLDTWSRALLEVMNA